MPVRPDPLDAENARPSYPNDAEAVDSNKLALEQQQGVEFSESLENSTPLEAEKVRFVTLPAKKVVSRTQEQPQAQTIPDRPTRPDGDLTPEAQTHSKSSVSMTPLVDQSQEVVIPLMDERVVVDWRRRKVGEVVVRKEVETRVVEVPIRREKLIVEQVSPSHQQLAVVELGPAQVTESEVSAAMGATQSPSVSGQFTSIKAAIQFLAAIAAEPNPGVRNVQINVALQDTALQATYQRWLDRYAQDGK